MIDSENSSPSKVKYLVIDTDFAGQRLDNFLFNQLKGVPKSRVYRAIRNGEVRINQKRIKPPYRLVAGDELRIPPIRQAEKAEIAVPSYCLQTALLDSILYEDDGLLVINKPSGVAVHGGSGVVHGVVEGLRGAKPEWKRLELAHRLDRDTSGCLMLAKKRSVLRDLHAQFRAHEMRKIYQCLVKGRWRGDLRRVRYALRKNQLSSGERMVRVDPKGQVALTEFRLLERFLEASFLEVNLETGRTHQIRVHAASIGHPLAGDDKYGDKRFNQHMRQLGLKRLFLHAKALELRLSTGKALKISAPLPDELQSFLERLS